MNRKDYFNTIEGQISLRRKRKRNKLLFMLDHEPKSKNSISTSEKIHFQSKILDVLKITNRRYFKSPVALEFDFFPTDNNPPAIHTLPKNYLDLLEKPVAGVKTKRKSLILENDRQVRYLAVRYHIGAEKPLEGIWIKVAPYRDFLAELEFLNKIQNKELGSTLKDTRHQLFSHSMPDFYDEEYNHYDDNPSLHLRKHEKNKIEWIDNFGEESYLAVREMLIIDQQNYILKLLSLSPNGLTQLLSPLFFGDSFLLNTIHKASREILISEPLAIELPHSNLKKGESSQYKTFVKDTMSSFKKNYSTLFPLLTPVGVTILFQPPAFGSIDLDNLARRIVPFVNLELEPPSNFILTVDAERIRDLKYQLWIRKKQAYLKRMPKHSITHYQVIQLPRLTTDEEHGFVRLILEPGLPFESVWSKVEDLVDRWEKDM